MRFQELRKIIYKMSELDLMIESIKINNPGIEENIIGAFRVCDRKFFVGQNSYSDEPQHIAHGQTISQPSTIARMIRILNFKQGQDILEIGANTGYHASLVSYMVFPGKVIAIEIFSDLARMAKNNIKSLIKHLEAKKKNEAKKFAEIKIIRGDAFDKNTKIWKNKYDAIYFTAGIEAKFLIKVKEMALKLLKDNGLLLFPTREVLDYGNLELWMYKNKKLELLRKEEGYVFVPLLGKKELKEIYKK